MPLGYCCCALVLLLSAGQALADELRVMTFNIRVNLEADGDNAWPRRSKLWFKTVRAASPDLLGLQEVTAGQRDEIVRELDDYQMVIPTAGKPPAHNPSPLMVRRGRFEVVRSGLFWLSQTPDVPGSMGWDAKNARVAVWAELRDRRGDPKGATIFFVNTHWDHIGQQARRESATLMRTRIAKIAGDARLIAPVIVTGDFNCSEDSEPYKRLLDPITPATSPADAGKLQLLHSFAEVHPNRDRGDYTFHGFAGTNKNRPHLDWILHTRDFTTASCEIDRSSENGRYPSDHFPVTAVLKYAPPRE